MRKDVTTCILIWYLLLWAYLIVPINKASILTFSFLDSDVQRQEMPLCCFIQGHFLLLLFKRCRTKTGTAWRVRFIPWTLFLRKSTRNRWGGFEKRHVPGRKLTSYLLEITYAVCYQPGTFPSYGPAPYRCSDEEESNHFSYRGRDISRRTANAKWKKLLEPITVGGGGGGGDVVNSPQRFRLF